MLTKIKVKYIHALLTLKKLLTQFDTKDYFTNLLKVEVKPMTLSNQCTLKVNVV